MSYRTEEPFPPTCNATIDLGDRGIHLCHLDLGHTGSHRPSPFAQMASKWDGNLSSGRWVPLRVHQDKLKEQMSNTIAWQMQAERSADARTLACGERDALRAEVERLKVDGAECDRRTARLRELARENAVLQQHLATTSQAHSDLEDQINDWCRDHAQVMSEKCPSDEKHCTCVPHLRAEIERLRVEHDQCGSAVSMSRDAVELRVQLAEAKREVERLGEPALLASNKCIGTEFDHLMCDYLTLKDRNEKLRGISKSFAEHVMSYATDERSLDTDWQALRRTCRATMEALAALDDEPTP